MVPSRRGSIAPVYFVPYTVTVLYFFPSKFHICFHDTANRKFFYCRRCPCKCSKIYCINSREFSRIFKINGAEYISIINAIFCSNVLVLLGIVFVCFHYAHPSIANIIKGAVMSSPSEAVETIDHFRVHFGHEFFYRFMNITCQLAGYTINFSTIKSTAFSGTFTFICRGGFRENTEGSIVDYPVYPLDVSDHVIV